MEKMICSKCGKIVNWLEYDGCGGCATCDAPVIKVIYPEDGKIQWAF